MYTIKAFVDGKEYMLHNPRVKNLMVGNPYFEIGDNVNGQAEFSVYPTHPFYKYVKKLTTDIIFYKDGAEVFAGRVLYDDEELNGTKKVFVEGELAYLCDSIQRQAVYHNISVANYLKALLDNHNSQVEKRKQFVLGRVSVTDPNDSLYRYSNYETTRVTLKDKLTSRLGGHLVIRKEAGVRYLDYLNDSDYYTKCSQEIRFGKNLLDFSKNIDASDLVTCLIPLGKKLDESSIEGLEERLTIKSVNGGVDYISDDNAVATYGKIYATQIWDDVTVPENLLKKAMEYLKKTQYEKMVLEIKAIDLNLTNIDVEEIKVGSMVRCVSAPNGLDAEFPVTKLKIYISDFQKNTITLNSESDNATYTSSNAHTTQSIEETIENIPTKSEILDEAFRATTEQMNDYNTRGHAIKTKNEFIVADTPGAENATKLWRWGAVGLAYYSHGYDGPIDAIAITMDGEINGKMIQANTIRAESLDVGYTKKLSEKISKATTDANTYSDKALDNATQIIESSISNLNDKISLGIASTKEIVARKNFVRSGESESIKIADYTVSGQGNVKVTQYLNQNALELILTSQGSVTISQNLGSLEEGNYTIAINAAYNDVNTRPSSIQYGFAGNQDTKYLVGYEPRKYIALSKTVKITKSSKTVSVTINGSPGAAIYVTNIRVLRELQEMIDEVNANIGVEVGKVNAYVNEVHDNSQNNYCTNGEFSDADGALAGWGVSGTVEATTYNKRQCCKLSGTGSIYWKQEIRKAQKFTVRFDACCNQENSGAQIKVIIAGHAFYTSESITENWKSFEFEAEVNPTLFYTYFCNNNTKAVAYVSNVEILGYSSYYAESRLTLLTDSIMSEVKRAKEAEGTLSSKVTQNAEKIETKVTADDVSSQIEQSAEAIRCQAKKISWKSDGSEMTEDGKLTCNDVKINGGDINLIQTGNLPSISVFDAKKKQGFTIHRSNIYGFNDEKTNTITVTNNRIGSITLRGSSAGDGSECSLYSHMLSLDGAPGSGQYTNISATALYCTGSKHRVVRTQDYGERLLCCYETPSPMFGDVGAAQIDETGKCLIFIDEKFAQTIDLEYLYDVFLTKYGPGDCYVSERTPSYFAVEGTKNLKFAWELKTIQRDYENLRLEEHTQEKDDTDPIYDVSAYMNTLLYQLD